LTSSQLLINRQLSNRWKSGLSVLLLATLYVSLAQAISWKSGWLPGVVSLIVIMWFAAPRFRFLAFPLGILALAFNFTGLSNLVVGGEDYSIMTRLDAWRIILEIVKVNPILGLGISNYYWYTSLFPILGYRVSFNSHNNYIDIFAQTGIVGLGCFLWFLWEVGRLGWRLKDRVPEGFAKAYVIGALGGLAGTVVTGMLGDWILPFVYNVGLVGFRSSVLGWLFLGGLVVLEQRYIHSNLEQTQ
jgi:O-antigen ligase